MMGRISQSLRGPSTPPPILFQTALTSLRSLTNLTTKSPQTISNSPTNPPKTSQQPRRFRSWQASASVSASASPKVDTKASQIFRLAPSDFAFLWQECRRCFYLKAHKKLYRPRAPFPSIFGVIDTGMKRHFRGLKADELIPEMPSGRFLCEEKDAWVESVPLSVSGHSAKVYIRGMVDCLLGMDDGTFGIIDFKTSNVSHNLDIYSRQLHAYSIALEQPSEASELMQGRVTDLGLVVYEPQAFTTPTGKKIGGALTGKLEYLKVPRNDDSFMAFLSDVLDVLTAPEPPPPPPRNKYSWANAKTSCPYCQYLHDASEGNFIPKKR